MRFFNTISIISIFSFYFSMQSFSPIAPQIIDEFGVSHAEAGLLMLLVALPAMTLMMTVDVVLRYVFNAPLLWGLELDRHLLVIVFMFGILECTRTDGNIRMDLLFLNMPARAQRAVTALYSLIGVGLFALLAHKTWNDIPLLWMIPETTEYLHLRIWAYYAMIVAVAALMIVYFLLRAILAIIGAEAPDESPLNLGREPH